MKKSLLFLLPSLLLTTAGCHPVVKYSENLDKYVKELEYRDGFNILQLTDIHWSTGTDYPCSKDYLSKLIEVVKAHVLDNKIDLIELTGDLFMLSNVQTVNDLLSFLEGLNIPYAATWGNHDREGKYNPSWLTKKFLNAKNSLYTEVDYDDVYGYSNYVINVKAGSDVKWQIANIDSGASYSDSAFAIGRTYDFIRESQAEWWKAEHDLVGETVPTIAYYHIPQHEMEVAFNEVSADPSSHKHKFYKLEDFASSEAQTEESEFFKVAKNHGLKAAFMGHAHSVDWTVDYEGVTLGLGVKSGKELYYGKIDSVMASEVGISEAFDMIGGTLVTLHDGGVFDLEHLYFNERAGGDFVRWVNY